MSQKEQADRELNRPTKIHPLVVGMGHAFAFTISEDTAHETKELLDLLDEADWGLLEVEGHSVAWPLNLAGDKGY